MSYQASRLLEKYENVARARSKDDEVVAFAKKSRGELEDAAAMGIAVLEASGMDLAKAGRRMIFPEMGLMIETSAERAVAALYASMDYEAAEKFNKDLSALETIPNDSLGHFAMWTFEDGSAWVSFRLHEREVAFDSIQYSDFESKSQVGKSLWMMWERDHAPLAMQVGNKFMEAKLEHKDFVALSASEARAMVDGLALTWGDGQTWGKGMSVKLQSNGSSVSPSEFRKVAMAALRKGRDELERAGVRRMDEIRKEREARMKIHWRDAMCVFISQSQALPVYDGGLAAFLMSKPGLFGQYPLPVWRKMFFEIIDLIKPMPEGESPDLGLIETSASILGGDIASQLAHYLYRYHRSGGAKLTAKRVLEQTKTRMLSDAAKHGLAAAVKSKEPISDEMRESSKAASSVEFSTQYGAALALYAALWAKESGFSDISMQARAVVKTMRGAGEISMECFGWFAKLMFEFSEGFISKEDIAKTLQKEMEDAAVLADEQKRMGGKITIENEWSGNWGSELAGRKVREYLGIEKLKTVIESPRKTAAAAAAAAAAVVVNESKSDSKPDGQQT